MSERGLRIVGIILMVAGFTLWTYGFVYSSFWYANTDISVLEPARGWVSDVTGSPILPGVIEEIIGLFAALLGIIFQVFSYYG